MRPHHPVLRVCDLVAPEVDPAAVRTALAAHGVPHVDGAGPDRDVPVGAGTRAVVTGTAAGTVVTLERRSTWRAGRRHCLRDLGRLLDAVLSAPGPPPGPPPG